MAGIATGWEQETLEAKAEWFRTLSPAERYDHMLRSLRFLCKLNPGLLERDDDRRASASVRVITLPQG